MNIKGSLNLAGMNLLHCLCPRQNYLPYWHLVVDKQLNAAFERRWPGHNIGRWWDALLRLEDATDFMIPAHIEAAMLQNTHEFFDNPDNLCFAPPDFHSPGPEFALPEAEWPWPLTRGARPEMTGPLFELHSLREGLLALHALVRFRHSRWAARLGHKMLETVNRALFEDCTWDLDQFDYFNRTDRHLSRWMADQTSTHGRLIEALVWFYEATGDSLSFELAEKLARHHLANTTSPDGTFNTSSGAEHAHSYLGTLRGLLLFGEMSGQRQYIDPLPSTFRVAVSQMVKESGFAAHDIGTNTRSEVTSPGDAVQLGLWLARHGYSEFMDDAERLVRARLIPSQIRESPGLHPAVEDENDEHSNLDERIVGGYGGVHTEPHAGKRNVTDVTAAVLHTLIDVYRHIVVRDQAGLWIFFHFDYEDERIRISSKRQHTATLTIVVNTRENVLIRIPRWTPAESVQLTVNGRRIPLKMIGDFALTKPPTVPCEIVLQHALPIRQTHETAEGVRCELTWRGDEIIGITPNSDFFPFYPTAAITGPGHSQ